MIKKTLSLQYSNKKMAIQYVIAIFLFFIFSSKVFAQDSSSSNDTIEDNTVVADGGALEESESPEENSSTVSPPETVNSKSLNSQAFDLQSFNPQSGMHWMLRMAQQIDVLSFEMVYVVTSEAKDTMPYIWRRAQINEGKFIEQLSVLNGPGFEQIVYDEKLSIFEPGYPPYSIEGSAVRGPIPNALLRVPQLLDKGYDIIPMGRNRISGRMSKQIRIVSKDQTRFGYHLWIDETSGVLLKLNTYNLDGRLIEQVQVTQLSISNEVNSFFVNFHASQMPEINPVLSHHQRELAWDVSFLPEGMEVVKKTLHRIGGNGQLTEYMLLSDGVVDVSVYLLNSNNVVENEVSGMSGPNAVVVKSDGQIQVTVLGKIPLVTAERIANSIVLVN